MPVALVTGATGLVGSHVVEQLVAKGWTVRALVRDPSRAAWLTSLGAEPVRGDVLDRESFVRGARGCEAIVHCAAAIAPRGRDWESFRSTNVEGTGNAVAAAAATSARMVQISSVAVYGGRERYREGAQRTDESTPLAPLPETAYYARSKRESEAIVLDAHARGEVWATAIRPCVIYGPRDRQFVPRIARLLERGWAPVINEGRSILSVIHAGNVADCAILALRADIAGGRAYNATNESPVSVAHFYRLAAEGLGRPIRLVRVPARAARGVYRLAMLGLRIARGAGAASLAGGGYDLLTRDNPFSSERARAELGWRPPIEPREGVPDSFRWWKTRKGAP